MEFIISNNYSEKKILALLLLLEALLFGLYFVHPIFSFLPIILFVGLIFLYFGVLSGPKLWIGMMLVATGLDQMGQIAGGITLFHVSFLLSIVTVIFYYLTNSKNYVISTPINKYIFAYLLISLISIIYSPSKLEGIQQIIITIFLFLFFTLIVNFIKSKNDHLIIVWSLLLTNIFNSLLIFYQIAFQNILFFGRGAVESTTGEKIWRASGAFYDPNVGAAFLIVGTILGLALILYSNLSKIHKLAISFSVGLSILGIFATFSRSGWIGLLIGMFMVGVFHKKKTYILYFTLAFFGVVLALDLFTEYGGFIINRFFSIFDVMKDVSIRTRFGLALSGIKMFIDNPILGVGVRGFPVYYDLYIDPITPQMLLYVKEAHTLYTLLLAELGLVGFFSVLFWFWKAIKNTYYKIKQTKDSFFYAILVGNFAVLISFIMTFFFYGNLFPDFNLIWLNLGIIYSINYSYFKKKLQ